MCGESPRAKIPSSQPGDVPQQEPDDAEADGPRGAARVVPEREAGTGGR